MNRLTVTFIWSLFLILCMAYPSNQPANAEITKESNISFRWAFGAVIGPENDRRLVAITRDTTLRTGDRIKMLIEMKRQCFIYLIYLTNEGEVQMLFPDSLKEFQDDYVVSKKYYVPPGDMWFELDDDVGLETFYLIASFQRLNQLEGLLKSYDSAQSTKKPELSKLIIDEIRKLRKQYRKLSSSAERPVPIGGSLRGGQEDKEPRVLDIDPIAGEVSADDFYIRTFTIDHK